MPDFKAGGPPPGMQEPIEEKETEPKRPRGRPRADGKPPGSVPPAPKQIRNLQPQIANMLMAMNFGLMLIPGMRQDQLDEVEILALSEALAEEAKRSPRFAKMVEGALAATGSAGLIGVLGLIVGRRLARHGVIPPEADQQLGMFLAMTKPNSKAKITVPTPVDNGNETVTA